MDVSAVGLHIRFEGDVTPLQTSIRKADATLTDLQKKLNSAKSALRFDPTSLKSLSSQTELASLKMNALADKIGLIRSEAASKNISFGGLASSATEASIKLTNTDARLKQVKERLGEVAKAQGIAFDPDDVVSAIKQFKNVDAEIEALIKTYHTLVNEHNKWQSVLESQKENRAFTQYRLDMEKAEAEAHQLQQTIIELSTKIGSSFSNVHGITEVDNKLTSIKAQLEAAKEEAKQLETAIELNPNDVEKAEQYVRNLAEQEELATKHAKLLKERIDLIEADGIKDTGTSAAQLAEKMEAAKLAFQKVSDEARELHSKIFEIERKMAELENEGKQNTQEWRNLNTQLNNAVKELTVADAKAETFRADIEKISAEGTLRKLKTEFNEVSINASKAATSSSKFRQAISKFKGSAASIRDLGTAMGAMVTPAIMTGFYKVISASEEIDSAYRNMRKTVNGTEEQFQELFDSAIEFSQTSIVSADQILEIEALGGQMGLAIDSLETFAETVSNLDISTNIDAETLAEQLGQMANIMGLTDEDFAHFGDSLVRLGNTMPTQESNIMEITSRIASMGTISGMTADQILGWSAAIASTGQNSEAAGTAMSKTMSQIETAVSSGGDKLDKFAEVAGMSSDAFAKLWDTNASDAMKKFVEGLHNIDKAGGSMDATLGELGITAVRQKQGLMGLAQSTDNLTLALANSKSAWADGGDAAEEARKKTAGFSGSLGILQNSASALAVQFGEGLIPFMDLLSGLLQTVTKWFSAMPTPMKSITVGMIGLVAVIGPLTRIFSQLTITMGNFKKETDPAEKATKTLNKNMKSMSSASTVLGTSFNNLKSKFTGFAKTIKNFAKENAFLLIITAVTALAGALTGWAATNAKIKKSVTAVSDAVRNGGKSIEKYQKALDSKKLEEAADKHIELAESIKTGFDEMTASSDMVNRYASNVVNMQEAVNNGTEDVSALQGAVSLFNDAVGTSYTVSQDASGQWQIMADNALVSADDIYSAAQTYLKAAKLQLYADKIKETSAQKSEDEANYSAALKAQAEAYAIYQKSRGTADEYQNYQAWQTATKNVEDYKKMLDDTTESLDKLAEKNEYVASTGSDLEEAFKTTGIENYFDTTNGEIDEFIKAWTDAGLTVEDVSSLSSSQILEIAAAFETDKSALDTYSKAIKDGTFDTVFSGKMNNMSGSAQSVASKIADAAGDIKSSMNSVPDYGSGYDNGANYYEGMYDGMKSWGSDIMTYARKVGDEINRTTKLALGENSPSKFARKFGAYYYEGLYLGMKDEEKSVYKQVRNTAKGINSNMKNLTAPSFDMAATASNASKAASNASRVNYNINFNGTSINAEDAMSQNFINNMYELQRLAKLQGVA